MFTSTFRKDSKKTTQGKTSTCTSIHVLNLLCRRQSWYTLVIEFWSMYQSSYLHCKTYYIGIVAWKLSHCNKSQRGFLNSLLRCHEARHMKQSDWVIYLTIGVKDMVSIPSIYLYRTSRIIFLKRKKCKQQTISGL